MMQSTATPAVVAQRMSELLLRFPSAAAGGVQWQTLIRKYNERHSTSLDTLTLGQSSQLTAATTLLWDVLRLVDTRDTHNPVVAVEDSVALTAKPGAPATWPSLYQSLCEIINNHGAQEEAGEGDKARVILVSKLKPLLQQHWHSSFDDGSLSYLTEEGAPVRVKKMKHLLEALLQWRKQRVAWRAANQVGQSALDAAIEPELELVPSKKQNDLLLRYVQPGPAVPRVYESRLGECQHQVACDVPLKSGSREDVDSVIDSSNESTDLMQEIATLRAENARLRSKNCILEQDEVLRKALSEAELMQDVLDNPSEPPPFEYWGDAVSPSGSTAVPSDFGFGSGCMTPLSLGVGYHSNSGDATPMTSAGQIGQVCTMVPMLFAMGDRVVIPNGVVQQARANFECHKALPSFFTHQ